MSNFHQETLRDPETAGPNYSISAPVGTRVCATEPNVRVEEHWDDQERRAAADSGPAGVLTLEGQQSWSIWSRPPLLPLAQVSSGDPCTSQEEGLPRLAQGSVDSPWPRDSSSRVDCEPGSWAPAFSPGSQRPEDLVGEQEPPGAPFPLVLQQPPCSLGNPLQSAPQQEAWSPVPGPTGQVSQHAAPGWWTGYPAFPVLLGWIPYPVILFPPGCFPAVFVPRQP